MFFTKVDKMILSILIGGLLINVIYLTYLFTKMIIEIRRLKRAAEELQEIQRRINKNDKHRNNIK